MVPFDHRTARGFAICLRRGRGRGRVNSGKFGWDQHGHHRVKHDHNIDDCLD